MNFFHGDDKGIFCQIFLCQLLGNIIFHIDTVADQNSFRLLIHRLLKLYNKAIVAALGQMLDRGESSERYDGGGRWLDIAGQYVTKRAVEALLAALEEGRLTTPAEVDNRFRVFFVHYDDYAHSWAEQTCAALLGHTPSVGELTDFIAAGRNAADTLRRMTDADRERDCAPELSVSYGLDGDDNDRMTDYRAVRGLNEP